MAFCKNCGIQIPDGTSQCASCAASSGAAAGQPAATPFNPADTGNFAPGTAPSGGFNPGAAPMGESGSGASGGFGGFDVPGDMTADGKSSKKGFIILGAAAIVLIAVLVFLFNIFFGGYKKPIKDIVKGINKIDADKAIHAIIPKNQFNDFKDIMEDETDDDYKDYIKDLEKDIKDEIKDNKIKYKVKVDFKGKKKVKGSTLDDIEETASKYFEDLGLDEVEVKKAYRVKVKLEGELKYKKESASAGITYNIYVVKYKGCSGWYLAPYSDEDSMGGWMDLAEDLYDFDLDDMMGDLGGAHSHDYDDDYDFDF